MSHKELLIGMTDTMLSLASSFVRCIFHDHTLISLDLASDPDYYHIQNLEEILQLYLKKIYGAYDASLRGISS